MAIKPEADNAHFYGHADERALAMRLGEAFDVTHGQEHGKLCFWLLQPTTRTQERFGLQKEVLAIYSRHPTTDARVLTAIETISRMPEFKHRVEKVLFLIVHQGDQAAASDLVKDEAERVIVPLAAKELLDPKSGDLFVRSQIANRLGVIDLFGIASPIQSDRYFFGRKELVQSLSRLVHVQRQNAGLFGLRKTGKTSVLHAVRRALEQQGVLTGYFDCQNPGIHSARWWQVLGNMTTALRTTLKRTHSKDVEIAGRYDQDSAGTLFASDIRSLLAAGGATHVLLMLDEIEWITPSISGQLGRHWDEDFIPFWQTIRATHQECDGRLSFMVAGVNPLSVQRSHFGVLPNPVFQLAVPHYLEPFSRDAVKEMVRTIGRYSGLSFDEEVYEDLRRTYGGHPFLIRIACSELWRENRLVDPNAVKCFSVTDFGNVRAAITSRLAQPIKDILLSLVWWYPDEYDVLQLLAAGETDFVRDYMQENSDSVLQFARYGLVLPEAGEFAIADIREFLKRFGDAYRREMSPFVRAEIAPQLLPSAPDIALLGRLFEKKVQLESKLRKLIIMYLGVRHAWNARKMSDEIAKVLPRHPEREDSGALFVGRKPQDAINSLFTLDLKAIVVKHWDVFGNVFEGNRPRFEMNMDAINVARRFDSHTLPVSAEEVEAFENSYQWVLARLRDIPLEGGV